MATGAPPRGHDLAVRDPRDALARRGARRRGRLRHAHPDGQRHWGPHDRHHLGARSPTTATEPWRSSGASRGARSCARRRTHQALRLEAEQLLRGRLDERLGPRRARRRHRPARGARWSSTWSRAPSARCCACSARTPSLQVLDRFPEQREQLAELRPTPSASMLDEGQRWVYYPWRRAAVRLLAPRGFATLRLDRNRNKLTRDEQSRLRTLRVGVIGLSVGHSIAHVPRDGGPRRRAAPRGLRHDRAVEPEPAARDRPRPRRQQGGGRGATHQRDRPVPARGAVHRRDHRRRTSTSSSTDSTSSSKSATRST